MKYDLFFEAHWEELTFHKVVKEAFLNLPDGKTPKVKDLNEEFDLLLMILHIEVDDVPAFVLVILIIVITSVIGGVVSAIKGK